MPLLTRRRQICAAINAGSSFDSGTVAAANVINLITDLAPGYDVSKVERNVLRPQIGQLAPIKGTKGGNISFGVEMIGSGTAGVAPQIGRLFKMCGFSETVNSGSAAVGSAVEIGNNVGTGSAPTTAGTFTGLKSGLVRILITAVTSNTSIAFQATFYPGDGTTPSSGSFTQSSGSAVTLTGVAAGATVDFGDPSSSTAGYVVGDQWAFSVTSSSEVSVVYKLRDSGHQRGDLAGIMDGNLHKWFGCMGDVSIEGKLGQIVKAKFDFKGVPAGFDEQSFFTSGIPTPGATPEPFLAVTPLYDGSAPECFTDFNLSLANDVSLRQCAEETYGFEAAQITGRLPKLTFNPESIGFNTFNPFSDLFANTTKGWSVQWGQTAGNIIKIECVYASTTGVSNGDRDGIMTDELEFELAQPATDPGSGFSELIITFT